MKKNISAAEKIMPTEEISSADTTKVMIVILILILVTGGFMYYILRRNASSQMITIEKIQKLFKAGGSPQPSAAIFEISPTPYPSEPDASVSGKIAYIKDGELYVINADRSYNSQITDDLFHKFSPSISQDGTKIAYAFYPKDRSKMTNSGIYVGYNSGISVVDVTSKEVKNIIPYGSVQNHYPEWFDDNRHVAIWSGNGSGASVYDTTTGVKKMGATANEKVLVSPIVWVTSLNKISFIDNKELLLSNIDGSDKQVLATGVDSSRLVHEGPNIPQPPMWSLDGQFVAYYKNGDLVLLNRILKTEIVVQKGERSEMFNEPYPVGFPHGFTADSAYFLFYTYPAGTMQLDIKTTTQKQVANFMQSGMLSPDGAEIYGLTNSAYTVSNTGMYVVADGTYKECQTGDFRHEFYTWSGGTTYQSSLTVWSPGGNFVIGQRYPNNSAVQVLNLDTCQRYDLVPGAVESVRWFPK